MSTKLLPIPDIPAGLREAAARTTLVPFIGAGASLLAGCPSWKDFADNSLRWLVAQRKFSYSQLDQISHLHPRVKLSLARAIANEQKTNIAYREILHPKEPRESQNGQQLYNALFRLSNIFVTTNYDVWLDERLTAPAAAVVPAGAPAHITTVPMNVVYRPEQINPALLSQPNTVIQAIEDPSGKGRKESGVTDARSNARHAPPVQRTDPKLRRSTDRGTLPNTKSRAVLAALKC
jgi:hypothetical protein